MFKLNPNPTFTAPVALSVPGLAQPLEVQLTFKHKGKEALGAWVQAAPERPGVDVLAEIIEAWTGLQDAEGKAVEYSYTALSTLLDNYPASQGEIFRAYLRELTEAKRKN